ncbi:proline--tRNA ligase, partial [bacterium]|nr:proline--tRNA ligase [bacterium]
LPDTMETVDTASAHSIPEVCAHLSLSAQHCVKTLAVHGQNQDGEPCIVALVVRGDHELNEIKAEKLTHVSEPLQFASDEEVEQAFGAKPGCIGPAGLSIPVIVDRSAAELQRFVCGANKQGFHYLGAQWERDVSDYMVADIRNVNAGDPSPDGEGTLEIKRGIEVGHIFQLGDKYSQAMNASVLNEQGKAEIMQMGCYGIGVTRVMAAAIEQNHDDNGILWPESIAPFQLALVPLNLHKSEAVRKTTESLYDRLQAQGIDVLLDDRNERPGVKFADMELIGVPHQLVIGDKSLDRNVIEYRSRRSGEKQDIPLDNALEQIIALLSGNSA